MSRVGKKPIPIPSGVKVKVGPKTVDVEGPKGKLFYIDYNFRNICIARRFGEGGGPKIKNVNWVGMQITVNQGPGPLPRRPARRASMTPVRADPL